MNKIRLTGKLSFVVLITLCFLHCKKSKTSAPAITLLSKTTKMAGVRQWKGTSIDTGYTGITHYNVNRPINILVADSVTLVVYDSNYYRLFVFQDINDSVLTFSYAGDNMQGSTFTISYNFNNNSMTYDNKGGSYTQYNPVMRYGWEEKLFTNGPGVVNTSSTSILSKMTGIKQWHGKAIRYTRQLSGSIDTVVSYDTLTMQISALEDTLILIRFPPYPTGYWPCNVSRLTSTNKSSLTFTEITGNSQLQTTTFNLLNNNLVYFYTDHQNIVDSFYAP
jgi:hypothetical protein